MAKWPTVVRLPSGLAHGRRTPEAPGSNPKVWLLLLWWCVLGHSFSQGRDSPIRMRFETGPCPKPGCESACFPQGLFPPPKTRPWVFRRLKRPVSIENLGIACGHSRRVFFRPQKNAPGFFRRLKKPIFIEHLGIAYPHSRRGFFRTQKHAPGFFGG